MPSARCSGLVKVIMPTWMQCSRLVYCAPRSRHSVYWQMAGPMTRSADSEPPRMRAGWGHCLAPHRQTSPWRPTPKQQPNAKRSSVSNRKLEKKLNERHFILRSNAVRDFICDTLESLPFKPEYEI